MARRRATTCFALGVLARLVRDEFPADRSLADIAHTWGNATPDELDALRAVEPALDER